MAVGSIEITDQNPGHKWTYFIWTSYVPMTLKVSLTKTQRTQSRSNKPIYAMTALQPTVTVDLGRHDVQWGESIYESRVLHHIIFHHISSCLVDVHHHPGRNMIWHNDANITSVMKAVPMRWFTVKPSPRGFLVRRGSVFKEPFLYSIFSSTL